MATASPFLFIGFSTLTSLLKFYILDGKWPFEKNGAMSTKPWPHLMIDSKETVWLNLFAKYYIKVTVLIFHNYWESWLVNYLKETV